MPPARAASTATRRTPSTAAGSTTPWSRRPGGSPTAMPRPDCSTSTSRTGYLRIQSTVSWPDMRGSRPIVAASLVSPPNGTVISNRGAIGIKILNEANAGVQGVSVGRQRPQPDQVDRRQRLRVLGRRPAGQLLLHGAEGRLRRLRGRRVGHAADRRRGRPDALRLGLPRRREGHEHAGRDPALRRDDRQRRLHDLDRHRHHAQPLAAAAPDQREDGRAQRDPLLPGVDPGHALGHRSLPADLRRVRRRVRARQTTPRPTASGATATLPYANPVNGLRCRRSTCAAAETACTSTATPSSTRCCRQRGAPARRPYTRTTDERGGRRATDAISVPRDALRPLRASAARPFCSNAWWRATRTVDNTSPGGRERRCSTRPAPYRGAADAPCARPAPCPFRSGAAASRSSSCWSRAVDGDRDHAASPSACSTRRSARSAAPEGRTDVAQRGRVALERDHPAPALAGVPRRPTAPAPIISADRRRASRFWSDTTGSDFRAARTRSPSCASCRSPAEPDSPSACGPRSAARSTARRRAGERPRARS